jgi:serine protease AprX
MVSSAVMPGVSIEAKKVQPKLVRLSLESPDELVRVIIQKADTSSRSEWLVESMGGEIIKDLSIINAFAAILPGRALQTVGTDPSIAWISLDAQVVSSGKPPGDPCASDCPPSYYLDTLNVKPVWDLGFDGSGIGIAVIDSGLFIDRDFSVTPGRPHTRVIKNISFNSDNTADLNGHGTHVAGIIGGNGDASAGFYSGVAPKVNFINLRVSDDFGMSYESDIVAAMQWIRENQAQYNIRVVNLSINSTVEMSYHDNPLNAAAEILWFNGIVVVASSGNNDASTGFNTINAAPANDPYIIVVGASHEQSTPDRSDDTVPDFTAQGITLDGFHKPDLIAPGKDIISVLSAGSDWYYDYPDRAILQKEYFRISGTSMAAPMVTGAVALLLQAEPDLTPDQVKYRLINTSGSVSTLPYLDVYKAITTPTTESANQGVIPHMLLAKMALIAYWSNTECGDTCDWENIDWGAVNWDSVNWNSVNWNSVNWNSVNWNSVNWNSVNWNSVNWNSVNWNSVNWNSVNWNSVNWNSVNWNSVNWNSVSWDD